MNGSSLSVSTENGDHMRNGAIGRGATLLKTASLTHPHSQRGRYHHQPHHRSSPQGYAMPRYENGGMSGRGGFAYRGRGGFRGRGCGDFYGGGGRGRGRGGYHGYYDSRPYNNGGHHPQPYQNEAEMFNNMHLNQTQSPGAAGGKCLVILYTS